jgi:hypothetical protein
MTSDTARKTGISITNRFKTKANMQLTFSEYQACHVKWHETPKTGVACHEPRHAQSATTSR